MRTLFSVVAAAAALTLSLGVVAAGCIGAGEVDSSEDQASEGDDLSGATAVARAMEWVSAKLPYCQAANHQRDYDDACSTYCDRQDNPSWDHYRSDCSGLISYAWGLPAPGRTTPGFAPYDTAVSHTINASALSAGDAVNYNSGSHGHIMLFVRWITVGHEAEFIEEPGCSTSPDYAHKFTSSVSISGSSIYVSYHATTFHAIRYDGATGGGGSPNDCSPGGLYCGGDKVNGDAGTLYRCTSGSSGTVVDHCAHGCAVNPGDDDACKPAPPSTGGGTSGGGCVAGGLYCGGDKVSGDHDTIYKCSSSGSAVKVASCGDGCQINPGNDDSCRGSGGCVAGGFYCGGDKVTGDPATLYKCTSGHSGSVAKHCASGCKINSGSDDACK